MLFVRTLGLAQIDLGHRSIGPIAVRKFALLLRLSDDPGAPISRLTLQDLIFPDLPARNARHSLRDLLYQIRRAGIRMEYDADRITIDPECIGSDIEALIRSDSLTGAQLKAPHGGLLPGYAPNHSEAFAEWLDEYRARITRKACKALAREMERSKIVGDWETAEHAARACLALEPSHEQATFALAELLAITGSKARAVALLDEYARDFGHCELVAHSSMAGIRRRINEHVQARAPKSLILPFLGREADMLLLRQRFDLARNGESQCVVLTGDAGIGKTRLAEEFCTQALLRGASVEHIHTQPHDIHRPMGTFADLVPRLIKLPGALGCSPESLALLRRLTTHAVDSPAFPSASAPRDEMAAAISCALADLIDSITSEATIVILVDDVQWTDELSRQTMASLVSAKHRRRLLVAVTSRDRSVAQFFARRAERMLVLALTPLTSAALAEMVRRVLDSPRSAIDDELRAWIAGTSGGNPFYLRCLVGHFRTSGERFSVPATLSSFLDQQIAALSSHASSVLSLCVVLGRHSDLQHLEAVLELRHLDLLAAISELDSSHLISRHLNRIVPAHWLIAEAAGRAVSPIAKTALHRHVARMLEKAARESKTASQLWDCAEHWILADEHARAVQVMRDCAKHSLEMGRPREAAEVLLRAAGIVAGPERLALVTAAVQLADSTSESDIVLRGVEFARSLNEQIDYTGFELAEIIARLATLDDATHAFDALRPWLEPGNPSDFRMRAGTSILILADQDNRPEYGREAYRALAGELTQEKTTNDLSRLTFLLIYHSRFGEIDTSLEVASKILELAKSLTGVQVAGLTRKCANAFFRAGKRERAIELLLRAFDEAGANGLLRLQCDVAALLAGIHSDLGRDAAATKWLATVERLADHANRYRNSLPHMVLTAGLACAAGDVHAAKQSLERGRANVARTPTARTTRWIAALDTWIKQLDGEHLDASTVVLAMTGHHLPNNEPGDLSDVETAVAATALANAGRPDEARALITRYLTSYRRVREGLARALHQAVVQLGGEAATTDQRTGPSPLSAP